MIVRAARDAVSGSESLSGRLFAENSWIQVMLGQGITPIQHHPVADLMGDQELSGFLADIKSNVDRTVAQLPRHQAYVEQYCKAAM